jgi:hypothetical protein
MALGPVIWTLGIVVAGLLVYGGLISPALINADYDRRIARAVTGPVSRDATFADAPRVTSSDYWEWRGSQALDQINVHVAAAYGDVDLSDDQKRDVGVRFVEWLRREPARLDSYGRGDSSLLKDFLDEFLAGVRSSLESQRRFDQSAEYEPFWGGVFPFLVLVGCHHVKAQMLAGRAITRFTIVRVVAAIMLLVAAGRWPADYYTLARLVACGTGVYGAYHARQQREPSWAVAFALLAVILNPFVPLRLDRSTWEWLDIGAAVLYLVSWKNPRLD